MRSFRTPLAGLLLIGLATLSSAWASDQGKAIAVTPFEFVQTHDPISGGQPTESEQERLRAVGTRVRDWVAERPELTEAEGSASPGRRLRRCDACALALGRSLEADWITVGWVQKVSELILNMNLVVWDVQSETRLAAVSIDMRGNTDESWRRAAEHMLRNLETRMATLDRGSASGKPPARSSSESR